VQFGTAEHFCTDYVNFVVTDFDGTYHAILGRSTLTKFIVVPHYSYLVLKMPTEHDVLTLRGNVYTTYTCEEEGFKWLKPPTSRSAWSKPWSPPARLPLTTWRS
jgi:hypothetical protein